MATGGKADLDPGPLRLKAVDAQDLTVISACLQDALVVVTDFAYQAETQRVVMLCNRFCWESPAPARIRSALFIDGVTAVKHRGIKLSNGEHILSLLAVRCQADAGLIELAFSAGGAIRLEVSEILCHLQDLGQPWPTPWLPCHEQEP